MSKKISRAMPENRGRTVDRKALFDAGYNSYEDGRGEYDFGPNSEAVVGDPSFAAIWRYGWQRAHEDSALSSRPDRRPAAAGSCP